MCVASPFGEKLSTVNIHTILTTLPLFKEMSTEEIERISQGCREIHVTRGEILFQRGDQPHGFYLVVHGQVKLAFSSPQGIEKVVSLMGAGKTFGEAVMFMNTPYPVYSQALMDSLLLHISKAVVFDGIDHHPGFSRKMLAGLSGRMHGLIADIEAYSLRSCTQRVIGYLLQHDVYADTPSAELTVVLPASKTVIASRLNISPETFSRVLHDLTAAGLISVKGKDVHIHDLEKLGQYGQL